MTTVTQNFDEKSNFAAKLKNATATAHDTLERLPISSSMMKDDVTAKDYEIYLHAMYQVIHEVETTIFPKVSSVISDIALRQKRFLIENDLKSIGSTAHPKKSVIFDNTNDSLPFIIGILYVVEGSTLGGRYMLKNIESKINFNEQKATTFLAGYGNSTGSMWKIFMKAVSEFAEKSASNSEIIAGANHGFAAIHQHFLNPLTK